MNDSMKTDRFLALKNSIEQSRKKLKPFRDELADVLRAYTGPHYGQQGGDDRPINMLQLSVESLLQQLSSRAPQVMCLTHKTNLKSQAVEMQLAINQALKQMKFAAEHRLWVLSAIFLIGIMEVGLDVVDTPEIDGETLPMTEVFCETIMFDDFVFDTTAQKWDRRQVGYWGHKYRMSLEEAKEDKTFDGKIRKQLKPIEMLEQRDDGTAMISQSDGGPNSEQFNPMCEIWQIYVPEEHELVTFTMDCTEPLKTVKWTGPKNGPYHLVGFNPVLNNIMPLPPVANWIALDDLENKLYTKLGEQASRQKTIGITDMQGVTDGQTIIKTSDGDVIAVGNPNAFKEAHFGGVDQQTLGFALNVKSMADFVMGNLSSQMGLGASANTLGQEEMIKAASNVRIGSMQGILLTATEEVIRDIAFYLHNHPTQEFNITREITGTDISIPMKWPRRNNGYGEEIDVRSGEISEYDISILPYSMQEIPPGQRAQIIRQIWREDIMPAIQLGIIPDVNAYISHLAALYDMPELRDIVKMAQEAMDPQERLSGGANPPMAGKPNGNYQRNNVSHGMTPQAADQQQMMMAMSGKTGEEGG